MPLSEIEDIIQHNRNVIVVVDEAYIDFGGESALPLIEKYDNLLVVQTFSKSRSMAGMRIGYAMGNEKLIKYINDVKYSFNSYTMNQTALALGVEAIKDKAYFEETRQRVIATREWTKQELTKLGFSFGDSMSNFIFATHERVPAKELFEALKKNTFLCGIFEGTNQQLSQDQYWNEGRDGGADPFPEKLSAVIKSELVIVTKTGNITRRH